MNAKVGIGIVIAVALAVAALLVLKARSHPAVTLRFRVTISPKEQTEFAAGLANSMKLKYLAGKQSGVKPGLAQKLTVKPLPDSGQLEAQIGVLSREQGAQYQTAFVEALQFLCGAQAQVTLAGQTMR